MSMSQRAAKAASDGQRQAARGRRRPLSAGRRPEGVLGLDPETKRNRMETEKGKGKSGGQESRVVVRERLRVVRMPDLEDMIQPGMHGCPSGETTRACVFGPRVVDVDGRERERQISPVMGCLMANKRLNK